MLDVGLDVVYVDLKVFGYLCLVLFEVVFVDDDGKIVLCVVCDVGG